MSPARMDVLAGDVNATGVVDGNDVSGVQGQTRNTIDTTNFKFDVDLSGLIDGNDVSFTQSQTRYFPSLTPEQQNNPHLLPYEKNPTYP